MYADIIWLPACFSLTMHHIDRDHFNLQYFAVTKHADAKEDWAKKVICNFVKNPSVDEAIPEQQHISWGVLSWANLKQANSHTL